MTSTDLTRSLLYLNFCDMDGLIDIARFGFAETNLPLIKQDLLQRLATAIVEPIAPPEGIQALPPQDFDDDNPYAETPKELFQGRVALAVFPLRSLGQRQPATSEG